MPKGPRRFKLRHYHIPTPAEIAYESALTTQTPSSGAQLRERGPSMARNRHGYGQVLSRWTAYPSHTEGKEKPRQSGASRTTKRDQRSVGQRRQVSQRKAPLGALGRVPSGVKVRHRDGNNTSGEIRGSSPLSTVTVSDATPAL
jgi:hypothetical protein